jgi:hypothetical protein
MEQKEKIIVKTAGLNLGITRDLRFSGITVGETIL